MIDSFQAVMLALFLRLPDRTGVMCFGYYRVLLAAVPYTIYLAGTRNSRPLETL